MDFYFFFCNLQLQSWMHERNMFTPNHLTNPTYDVFLFACFASMKQIKIHYQKVFSKLYYIYNKQMYKISNHWNENAFKKS
jgi:hypothetical protein